MWVKKCVEIREILFKNTNQTPPKSLTKRFLVSIKASEILQCERVISMILMQYKERNW